MDAHHHVMTMAIGRRLARILDGAATALLCLSILLLALLAIGGLLGYRGITVRSGSMTPALAPGDLVMSTRVHPAQVRPGQIITFRDPALHQQLVTHRVMRVTRVGQRVDFVTKGDANVATERWNVPLSASLGREAFAIPRVGRWLADVNSREARVIEVALAVLWLGNVVLRRIWHERRPSIPSLSAT